MKRLYWIYNWAQDPPYRGGFYFNFLNFFKKPPSYLGGGIIYSKGGFYYATEGTLLQLFLLHLFIFKIFFTFIFLFHFFLVLHLFCFKSFASTSMKLRTCGLQYLLKRTRCSFQESHEEVQTLWKALKGRACSFKEILESANAKLHWTWCEALKKKLWRTKKE